MFTQVQTQPTLYRLRRLKNGQFVVEDERNRPWTAAYVSDSASDAFRDLRERVHRHSGSYIVCADCGQELLSPMLRSGKVVCDRCFFSTNCGDPKSRIVHLLLGYTLGLLSAYIVAFFGLLASGVR